MSEESMSGLGGDRPRWFSGSCHGCGHGLVAHIESGCLADAASGWVCSCEIPRSELKRLIDNATSSREAE
jgi:hypothetical protein